MIAIDIGSERNAAVTHLAKPVELSVEGEVLKNPEDGHAEGENHDEPDEILPVFESAENLDGQEEREKIGQEELQLDASFVRRNRNVKNPLPQSNQKKSGERKEQRGQEKRGLAT